MNPIYTFNDTTIEIQIIEKGCYYKTNIPNNDINKKLIENPKSNFKFDKCGSGIIMHDDIHVFQLGKMECNYSDYIEMQNKLENTEKEVILLKQELSKNESLLQQQINIYYDKELDRLECLEQKNLFLEQELNNNNDLLQQQIKLFNDKSIAVKKEIDTINSKLNNTDSLLQQQIKILKDKHKKEIDNLKNELNDIKNLLQKQIEKVNDKSIEDKKDIKQLNKDINLPFVFIFDLNYSGTTYYHNNEKLIFYYRSDDYNSACYIPHILNQKDVEIGEGSSICATRRLYQRIIIPPGKVLISIEHTEFIKIYNKGIHNNIHTGELIILINDKDIDIILALCKKEPVIQNLIITQIESEYVKE